MWNQLNKLAETAIGKIFSQFVIISLGGFLITQAYNHFAELRERKIEEVKTADRGYWTRRQGLFDLYYDQYLGLVRLIGLINSGEISRAEPNFENVYQKAVDRWTSEQFDYFGPLVFGPLGKLKFCPADMAERLKSCPRYMVFGYDPLEEKNKKEGYYVPPQSVHYAFLNARNRVREILASPWARCMQLVEASVERRMKDCTGSDSVEAMLACSEQVDAFNDLAKQQCKTRDGYKLRFQLARDRIAIYQLWEKFRGALDKSRKQILSERTELAGQN